MEGPRQVIEKWVAAFNSHDADAAAALYHDDATNTQVAAGEPAIGRDAIHNELRQFLEAFPDNYTNIENLFEDGKWVIVEGPAAVLGRASLLALPATASHLSYKAVVFSMS